MKNVRFYKLVILLLVLINIAALSAMWFRRPPGRPGHKGKPPISEIISLNGQAKITVDSLERNHHQNKQAMVRLSQELRHQLFDAVGNDKRPILRLQQKLDSTKAEIEHLTFNFFNEVSKNCNETQKVQLKKFIRRTISRAHHRPPGSMGPPHGGQHKRR
ncbi:MAG: hypothetical protein P8N52_06325 [Crocinitomicaceae bacterium]|nr:hypothetical protein [Crocinitomicaceae bacterium]